VAKLTISPQNLALLRRAASFLGKYAVRDAAERIGAKLLAGTPFLEGVAQHMCEKENGAGSWMQGTAADRARWNLRAAAAVEGIVALIPRPEIGSF
jgi:hypothetical protein